MEEFIEKRFKALIPNILGIIEIAFPYSAKTEGEMRFKMVRKKILDAINDAKRDIIGALRRGNEGKKV